MHTIVFTCVYSVMTLGLPQLLFERSLLRMHQHVVGIQARASAVQNSVSWL